MVGKAKSKATKEHEYSEEKAALQKIAVERYRQELQKKDGKIKGARKICAEVEIEYKNKTGKYIPLSHATITRHANGGKPMAEFNAEKCLLSKDEEEVILGFIQETANRGFPLSHRRLREHANSIIKARNPSFEGVGECWTDRFVLTHSKRIQTIWSTSLEGSRARSANPANNKEWFDLLATHLKDVDPDCIWAADETGIQTGTAVKERVIGTKGKTTQHQTREGNRENITAIVTICADGSSIPPAIIFKGQSFLVSWQQENPLGASLGHSKKGWTDGEIGREWIEDFDKKTRSKANGRKRYLLVDGHNSHYTVEFLTYAIDNNIAVLCYPSHCTHIYQGLDVVIFSPLKKFWQQERDREERDNGQKVSKTNFLSVYARAHLRALTPANIKAAFKKTGVYPFNPSVITDDQLAPARETSIAHHAIVPMKTPVRVLVSAFTKLERRRRAAAEGRDNDSDDSSDDKKKTNVPKELISAFAHLSKISHPLFTDKPLGSHTSPPEFRTTMISPVKRHGDLLTVEVQTEHERLLQAALRDAEIREAELKGQLRGQQAALVLQNHYCGRLRNEIQGQEEKRKKKTGAAMKIKDINKKGRLLTDTELVEIYAEHQHDIESRENEKAKKKEDKRVHEEAMVIWRAGEEARKRECDEINARYQEAIEDWTEEKELAKREKRRSRLKKPVRGPLPKAAPKPRKRPEPVDEESGEEFVEENNQSSGSDEA